LKELVLKTDSLELTYCGETGVLYGVKAVDTGWDIMGSPSNGLSWRIMLPLSEELRNNDILGEKQTLASVAADADKIEFIWNNITSERGGVHDITVKLIVRAEGRSAVYEMEIENRSPYVVENVYCPYLVDVNAPKGASCLKTFFQGYAAGCETNVWPQYQNTVGYFGADYPMQVLPPAPGTPFMLIRSENQGLYMGIQSKEVELVSWFGELRPGWGSSIDGQVPKTAEIAGKPVEKRFSALHVPYIMPGETRSIAKIALAAYEGGWQEGTDIYTAWRKTWLKTAPGPKWVREPHAWQQLHINSPEDELRMRFTELPKVAESCKKYGIEAIQLVGWNNGGQDQGNPSHDLDPRLGTFEELKEAIAQCHAMGVKVILFTKFTWADQATEVFVKENHKHAIKDPYGNYYVYAGYRYQTGTQLMDINTKRLIPMCFNDESYLQLCEREFKKVVDLGAAGMLFDECQHHGNANLCFDESHGHRYGWPVYANDRELVRRLRKVAGTPEDFLMAGEACYDFEMEQYEVAYYRTESKTHIPLNRYMHPHSQYMTAVTGFNDRNMINQCLMFRFIVSYEPYNFKGSLDDYPDTVAYGQKMDALRTEYRKWFWDGEYRGTAEATVTKLDGTPHGTYGVFKADDGSLGVAVCNYEDNEATVSLTKADGGSFTKYRLVDSDAWQSICGGVVIPPQSAAIVL